MKYFAYAIKDGQGKLWGDRWRESFSDKRPPKLWSRFYDASKKLACLERVSKTKWWGEEGSGFVLPLSVVVVEING